MNQNAQEKSDGSAITLIKGLPARWAVVTGALLVLSIFLIACGAGAATTSPTGPTARPASTSTPESPVSWVTITPAAAVSPSTFRLTILHNNDGESQLVNLGPGLEAYGGVAQFAAVVQREKATAASEEGSTKNSGVIMVSTPPTSVLTLSQGPTLCS